MQNSVLRDDQSNSPTLDYGLWATDFGLRTLDFDFGLWTLTLDFDFGLRTLDFGLWTSTLDFGLRTQDFGLWTSDFGLWTMDYGLRLWSTKLLVLLAMQYSLSTDLVTIGSHTIIGNLGSVRQDSRGKSPFYLTVKFSRTPFPKWCFYYRLLSKKDIFCEIVNFLFDVICH